jgi:uncharacterized membrane protein HdeD (DUF308 family)
MLKSLSTSLIARGILAVIVGIIALAWPSVTVLALVILFAVYAFMASGIEAARGFTSRDAGPVIGHLLLGLVDLAAGMVALVWPGPTALVLRSCMASSCAAPGRACTPSGRESRKRRRPEPCPDKRNHPRSAEAPRAAR